MGMEGAINKDLQQCISLLFSLYICHIYNSSVICTFTCTVTSAVSASSKHRGFPPFTFLVTHWSSTLSDVFPKNTEAQAFHRGWFLMSLLSWEVGKKGNSGVCNKKEKIPKLLTKVQPSEPLPEGQKKSTYFPWQNFATTLLSQDF